MPSSASADPEIAAVNAALAAKAQAQAQAAANTDEDRLFENAKSYLMQADADGQSVYDLLYKTVYSMLEENPEDVANHPERLNEVLSMLKKHQFEGVRVPTATSRDVRELSKVHPTQTKEARRNLSLLEQPKPKTETKIERPSPGVTVTTTTVLQSSGPSFQSVAKDNAMWRFCGSGLPEQEAFLIDQSIAKLAREKSLEEVRFVGKIFGLRGNYLILSTKRYVDPNGKEQIFKERYHMPKPPRRDTKVDVQPEPAFKGCNQKSFWVASEPGGEWTLLPDTTPQNINAARSINKLFTGDLDAPIVVHPPFHGSDGLHGLESEYLRAQLSRIVAATFVSPVGALERYENENAEDEDEEDDEEPLDEDGKPKPPKAAKYQPLTQVSKDYQPDVENGVGALADLEQWVHSEPFIFKDGRMTRVPPKPEEDEEEEPEQPEDEEEEENAEPREEEVEEEERDLFQPVKRDFLHGVITIPKEPNPEDDEEEEAPADEENGDEALDAEALAEKEREEEEALKKPVEDDEVADDDPLKKKVSAWTSAVVNAIYKKHGVAAVRSIRWPGAVAFAANGGKHWGCVYLGDGLKKTDYNFVPTPAPRIQKECKDLTEVMDPTAANEKLVARGEDPRENDSEDEQPDEEEEEM